MIPFQAKGPTAGLATISDPAGRVIAYAADPEEAVRIARKLNMEAGNLDVEARMNEETHRPDEGRPPDDPQAKLAAHKKLIAELHLCLRDEFAMNALTGLLAGDGGESGAMTGPWSPGIVATYASRAYQLADAMLAERARADNPTPEE
jgi:hypothetical protein